MLFSCCKYVILERPSWKLPSALSKNCVSIFIYFCINICFCIKQANKICTLLNLHLLTLIVFSVQGFGFTKPWVYVRCSEGTLKLVVKRSLSTCQPISQCFSLLIYFPQSFWVQYFASTATCLLRLFTQGFYHGT